MSRLGLVFPSQPEVPRLVEMARLAERLGYHSVWVAETRIRRDGLVPLAAVAQATQSVRLGTATINVFTRAPVLIAVSLATLAELAPGRLVLGLSTGSPLVLEPQGIAFQRPLTRLRESVEVIRALLRGEEVRFRGRTVRVDGARLEVVPPSPLPIFLGTTGPKALELTGEIADGAILNAFLPPSYALRARERIATGARRAGRAASDLEIAGIVVVSLETEELGFASGAPEAHGRVLSRAREAVAGYLTQFPNIARETGLHSELIRSIAARTRNAGPAAGAELVPELAARELLAVGTVEEVQERLEDYRQAGVDEPIIFPLSADPEPVMRALAPGS